MLGATFDDNTAAIRGQLESSMAAALSTPPALLGLGAAPASERRELQRQYVSSVARPITGLISAELSRVLGADIRLEVGSNSPADLVSRSRAFGSLVKAGVSIESAASATGFSDLAPATEGTTR